jgi:hypothetical protein
MEMMHISWFDVLRFLIGLVAGWFTPALIRALKKWK